MSNYSKEIDEWELKTVQERYKATCDLVLTVDQAKRIHKYEKDRDTHSDKHYFSVWEEWDFELTTFKQILNEEQLGKYETLLKENISRYEQSLIKLDGERSNEIIYHEELTNFYETKFLPDFFKDPLLMVFVHLGPYKIKLDFLKAEYKQFLNDTKKEILTTHFRHHRTFKPNELTISLLRHKRSYFFPDYKYFKHQMDEPTKAVANYLKSKFRYLPQEIDELLTRKLNELKQFHETNFKQYLGDTKGWHVPMKQASDEEEIEHRTMTFLLLDEEKYGC